MVVVVEALVCAAVRLCVRLCRMRVCRCVHACAPACAGVHQTATCMIPSVKPTLPPAHKHAEHVAKGRRNLWFPRHQHQRAYSHTHAYNYRNQSYLFLAPTSDYPHNITRPPSLQ